MSERPSRVEPTSLIGQVALALAGGPSSSRRGPHILGGGRTWLVDACGARTRARGTSAPPPSLPFSPRSSARPHGRNRNFENLLRARPCRSCLCFSCALGACRSLREAVEVEQREARAALSRGKRARSEARARLLARPGQAHASCEVGLAGLARRDLKPSLPRLRGGGGEGVALLPSTATACSSSRSESPLSVCCEGARRGLVGAGGQAAACPWAKRGVRSSATRTSPPSSLSGSSLARPRPLPHARWTCSLLPASPTDHAAALDRERRGVAVAVLGEHRLVVVQPLVSSPRALVAAGLEEHVGPPQPRQHGRHPARHAPPVPPRAQARPLAHVVVGRIPLTAAIFLRRAPPRYRARPRQKHHLDHPVQPAPLRIHPAHPPPQAPPRVARLLERARVPRRVDPPRRRRRRVVRPLRLHPPRRPRDGRLCAAARARAAQRRVGRAAVSPLGSGPPGAETRSCVGRRRRRRRRRRRARARPAVRRRARPPVDDGRPAVRERRRLGRARAPVRRPARSSSRLDSSTTAQDARRPQPVQQRARHPGPLARPPRRRVVPRPGQRPHLDLRERLDRPHRRRARAPRARPERPRRRPRRRERPAHDRLEKGRPHRPARRLSQRRARAPPRRQRDVQRRRVRQRRLCVPGRRPRAVVPAPRAGRRCGVRDGLEGEQGPRALVAGQHPLLRLVVRPLSLVSSSFRTSAPTDSSSFSSSRSQGRPLALGPDDASSHRHLPGVARRRRRPL